MTWLRLICSMVALAVVVTVVLLVLFAIRTFAIRPSQVTADAVVVLVGGRGRVEEGVRLYREGRARWLFLVGVDPSVRKRDLFREAPGGPPSDGVILEQMSRNTLENALYARELLERKGVRSLILITSRYHQLRARLLFHHVLEKDMTIHLHPVDSKNLREAWWSHADSLRLLTSEFYKYCLYRVLFLVAPGELRPLPTQPLQR